MPKVTRRSVVAPSRLSRRDFLKVAGAAGAGAALAACTPVAEGPHAGGQRPERPGEAAVLDQEPIPSCGGRAGCARRPPDSPPLAKEIPPEERSSA